VQNVNSSIFYSKHENFSGADLAALVHEAAVSALRENLTQIIGQDKNVDDITVANSTQTVKPVVGQRHFDQAFACVRPSVSEKVLYYLKYILLFYSLKK